MPCDQHSGGVAVDGCEHCALVDKAAGWVAWLDHRLDVLDDDAASIADQMALVAAVRDDIEHHLEHSTLSPERLLELIAPFVPSPSPAPAVSVMSRPAVPPGVTDGLERLGGPLGNGVGTGIADGRHGVGDGQTDVGGSREPLPGRPGRVAPPPFAAARLEVPHVSASVALSAVGALLVLVAAIVFTAVSWGRLGEGGRVAVMLAFLAVSTAITAVTHRRGLWWTAETMAWLTASLAAVETIAMTAYDIVLYVDTIPVIVLCTGIGFTAWSGVMTLATRGADATRHHLAQPWQATPLATMVALFAWFGGLDGEVRRVWWGPFVALAAAGLYAVSRRVLHRAWWVWTCVVSWVVAMVLSITSLDGSWQRLGGALVTSAVVLVVAGMNYLRRVERDSVPVGDVAATVVLFVVPAVHLGHAGERAIDVAVVLLSVIAVLVGWSVVQRSWSRRVAGAALMPVLGAAVVALDDASTGTVALLAAAVPLLWWARWSTGSTRAASLTTMTGMGIVWCGYLVCAFGLPVTWSATVTTSVASLAAVVSLRGLVRADWMSPAHPAPPDAASAATVTPPMPAPPMLAPLTSTPVSASPISPWQVVVIGLAGASLFVAAPNSASFATAVWVVCAAAVALLDRMPWRIVTLPLAASASAVAWATTMASRRTVVVEAYTLPIAVVFVAAGVVAMRWWRPLTSWVLAPGLVVAALPTMAYLATDVDGLTRWSTLLVAGTVVAVIGGRLRLAAPLVVGVAATAAGAMSQLGPWAVGLPRWLTIGVAGAALLVAGARFESVRLGARRLGRVAKRFH